MTRRLSALALLLLTISLAAPVHAASLAADAEVLAATPALLQGLPVSRSFTVATAGQLEIRLVDLAAPVNFTSLQVVVSRGPTRVTKLDAAGTVQFAAQPGTYKVQVIGVAPQGSASTFSVDVRTVTPSASLLLFTDGMTGPLAATDPATSSLETAITVSQAGTYQLTLTDRSFPVALTSLNLILLRQGGVPTILSGPCSASACVATFTAATPGTYNLTVLATAAGTDKAGLYSVAVTGPTGGATVYGTTQPVGQLPAPVAVTLAAGNATLTLNDFANPVALSALQAVVAQGANLLAAPSGAGTTTFSGAAAGAAQFYVFARVGSGAGAGSYGLKLAQGTQSVLEDARPLPAGYSATANVGGYRFPATIPAAGSYTLQLRDHGFPTAFTSLRTLISQGGALTQAISGAGSATTTLVAGPATVIVLGTPPSTSSNSLFGLSLTPAAGTVPVLEQAQGVGGLFRTVAVTIGTTGSYDLTLNDLQFPTAFSELAIALTQGPNLRGQIFGGGRLTFNAATAGTYSLNVLARLGTNANYGTWGFELETTPPPPTITFTATPTSVPAQQTSSLQWTVTGATSCTASGGWTGTKATSGTETTTALSADTTYTLTCAGLGGSTNRSVTVTIAAASASSGGGGGGRFDYLMLAGLAALLLARRARLQ